MTKKSSMIYQFKITLDGIRPPIWRRIQVAETYTFWDLHIAIQDAMGWMDCHLHQFDVINPKHNCIELIGVPNDEWHDDPVTASWKAPIKRYFLANNTKSTYLYDFGDGWIHKVELEKVLPAVPLIKYPICITGKRACPPEDCGGPYGYENFLHIIADSSHEEHKNMMEWIGKEFHPDVFFTCDVHFSDPKERLKLTKDR